jgi:hypothetical protein
LIWKAAALAADGEGKERQMTMSDPMQRLRDVLSAYGADRARWPAAERSALEAFIAENAEAQALVAQEAEFDGLLAEAAEAAPPAAVARTRASLLEIIDADSASHARAEGIVVPLRSKSARPAAPVPTRSVWRELSVMAAALLIGFFTVSQGFLEGSSLDPSQFTSSASDDGDDVSAIALGTTDTDATEEDLL